MYSLYLLGFGALVGATQFNTRVFWLYLAAAFGLLQVLLYAVSWLASKLASGDMAAPGWFVLLVLTTYLLPLAVVARGAFLARRRIAAGGTPKKGPS